MELDDVEDCVVEERYQTSDTHDCERLNGKEGEDDSGESGRKECLVDTEEAVGVVGHIELEGEGRQQIHKVYSDRSCEGAIVEAISKVGPVVWKTPANVVIHASPWH